MFYILILLNYCTNNKNNNEENELRKKPNTFVNIPANLNDIVDISSNNRPIVTNPGLQTNIDQTAPQITPEEQFELDLALAIENSLGEHAAYSSQENSEEAYKENLLIAIMESLEDDPNNNFLSKLNKDRIYKADLVKALNESVEDKDLTNFIARLLPIIISNIFIGLCDKDMSINDILSQVGSIDSEFAGLANSVNQSAFKKTGILNSTLDDLKTSINLTDQSNLDSEIVKIMNQVQIYLLKNKMIMSAIQAKLASTSQYKDYKVVLERKLTQKPKNKQITVKALQTLFSNEDFKENFRRLLSFEDISNCYSETINNAKGNRAELFQYAVDSIDEYFAQRAIELSYKFTISQEVAEKISKKSEKDRNRIDKSKIIRIDDNHYQVQLNKTDLFSGNYQFRTMTVVGQEICMFLCFEHIYEILKGSLEDIIENRYIFKSFYDRKSIMGCLSYVSNDDNTPKQNAQIVHIVLEGLGHCSAAIAARLVTNMRNILQDNSDSFKNNLSITLTQIRCNLVSQHGSRAIPFLPGHDVHIIENAIQSYNDSMFLNAGDPTHWVHRFEICHATLNRMLNLYYDANTTLKSFVTLVENDDDFKKMLDDYLLKKFAFDINISKYFLNLEQKIFFALMQEQLIELK